MKKWIVLSMLCVGVFAAVAFKKQQPVNVRAALGKQLFFDPILSMDSTLSCASCHKPEFAFADTVAFSSGFHGNKGLRNAPSVMNMSDRTSFFWDGRAPSLQAQAVIPMTDTLEMALPIAVAIKRLNSSVAYKKLFYRAFKQLPNARNLGLALAAFEQTLETSDTPLDRWSNGPDDAMTDQQRRGREVFLGKGQCIECHFTPDFTGDEFRSIGLFDGKRWTDSGRYRITRKPEDIGKFKVPGLRNVAITAPYMHDGSFKTLREVIDYYNDPDSFIPNGLNRDSLMDRPRHLTEKEKTDLEAFLHALTDDRFIKK